MFQDWGFLLTEMFVLIILAVGLGLLAGWVIWGRGAGGDTTAPKSAPAANAAAKVVKEAPAQKPAAKKPAAKKDPAKPAAAKKESTKTAAKKPAAKKPAAKKPAAKTAKKPAAK